MLGFRNLDRILRGEHRRDLSQIGLGSLFVSSVVLAAFYGVCMGFFSLFGRPDWDFRQVIACMLKVPSMLMLSLAVTFPSLYVFNTLLGSRLTFADLARLLLATLGILVALLGGFGPIVAFFSVTSVSYPFAIIMNVVVMGSSAVIAILHLQFTLGQWKQQTFSLENGSPEEPAHPKASQTTRFLFALWTGLFGLVGMQMSWVLRPFIGSPGLPFEWFRPRDGSFFEAVARSIRMISGH